MNEWKKVKIGDFLTEREGRYKPNDPKISKYRRLDKIDFSGEIHISDKPTKTDMILVQPGDLVISGINVAKGAITVYQGAEPICATIHYSAYTFDDSIVDLEFFEYFVKSPAFVETLKQQIKGGIKTEIKPKHLLPLEISIPNLNIQKQIVAELSKKLNAVKELSIQISKQKEYIKSLRANILQDAIEGKLTADWRKQNPVQKGNPDYDAEALFEQIQKGEVSPSLQPASQFSATPSAGSNAARNTRSKTLAPITDEEKPFEIPEGWKWVRLGAYLDVRDGTHDSPIYVEKGYPFVTSKNLINGAIDFSTCKQISKKDFEKFDSRSHVDNGDILYAMIGSIGNAVIVNKDREFAIKNVALFKKHNILLTNMSFVYYWLCFIEKSLKNNAAGALQPFISLSNFRTQVFPVPPLKEQEEIVNKVETLLAKVTTLENQIQDRKSLSDKLIFGILKENLEGK